MKLGVQVAPFRQGLDEHVLRTMSHRAPEKPGKQVHWKPAEVLALAQVPKPPQGWLTRQKSSFVSQLMPVKDGGHWH